MARIYEVQTCCALLHLHGLPNDGYGMDGMTIERIDEVQKVVSSRCF